MRNFNLSEACYRGSADHQIASEQVVAQLRENSTSFRYEIQVSNDFGDPVPGNGLA